MRILWDACMGKIMRIILINLEYNLNYSDFRMHERINKNGLPVDSVTSSYRICRSNAIKSIL